MNWRFRTALFALFACAIFIISSCEKLVIIESGTSSEADGAAKLTIVTRGDDDSDDDFMLPARIYIFRQSGGCVQILDTDGEGNAITTQLVPGAYTLYVVASDDLNRFTLPEMAEATSASVITLREGKVMESFFSKQANVILNNGDDLNEKIVLERKMLCLNKIEIKSVPTNVTAVEVTMSPFHNAILLDGTFPSTPITDYKVSLVKQSNGTTWQTSRSQLLFPSIGAPTVTISFTTAKGTEIYYYEMSEALEANHHYDISGTYKSSTLTVTLVVADWGDERDVDFEFSEADVVHFPVAGENYNGYYVVSVNEQARTAVLLSEMILYDKPAEGSKADETAWRKVLEASMAVLDKPANIASNWRLPTVAEVKLFTKDENAVTFSESGVSAVCFCEDENGKLIWAYTQKGDDGSYTFKSTPSNTPPDFHSTNVRLRPVIDITY